MTLLGRTIILFHSILMQEQQMNCIVRSSRNDNRRNTKYRQWGEFLRRLSSKREVS